jgi:signal transduction histidine kinase
MLERAVSRMEGLIRDLTDATNVDSEALPVAIRAEEVAPILQETVEQFAPIARGKGIALVLAGVSDAVVLGDRERLLQVLGNLVANAVTATPAHGWIRLGAQDLGEVVRFEVEDTGAGIPSEHLPRIFERYWKAGGQGTGLGLFIARAIVTSHRGEIWVQSTPGFGSTFFFTVPRAHAGLVSQTQPQAASAAEALPRPVRRSPKPM